MTETEKMQKLHLRRVAGEELSPDEAAALQNWYDELDREEVVINSRNRPLDIDLNQMREALAEKTRQILSRNHEIAEIITQNEVIRRENERLRQLLEARLSERSAA